MSDVLTSRKMRGEQATREQRRASDPMKSVWVEASAGTGKTKVLSDRVLRLLLSGVRPEKILCLTYTKAAAVEMSSRIAGRLSRWAVVDDEILYKELEVLLGEKPFKEIGLTARKLFAVLLDTPGGMKIQTIHSFCQEVLKRFPLEAKISPYFEVMDERMANEVLAEIKDEMIREIELAPESELAQAMAFLTRNVSEYGFPKIMNSVAMNRSKISNLMSKYENISEMVQGLVENLEIDDNLSAQNFFASMDEGVVRKIMQAWFSGSPTVEKSAVKLARILESCDKAPLYDEYKSLFLTRDGSVKKTMCPQKLVTIYAELETEFGREAERILEFEERRKSLAVFEATKAVLVLAESLIGRYNEHKALNSKMDYEDLIVLTKKLLENKSVADWVLYKLDGGIDHVLIDEAQDTSALQWDIVKAVTEEFFAGDAVRTVFAVGDRKQSIYSFQGADPREFEKSRKYFAAKVKDFENVKLEVSFRSTSTVLDLVNHMFRDEALQKGVVLEGEDITHLPFRMGDGGRVEMWEIAQEEAQDDGGFHRPVSRRSKETASVKLAREIAKNIKNMVESGDVLVSKNKKVEYRDFLVLVQRRNSFVEELVRECKNIGVNIAGIDKIRLLDQIAVLDLIAIGEFLLLPTDDLTLATILKCPVFGLDDDDLFKLCYNRGETSVWARLAGDAKYEQVYETLKDLLGKVDFMRPFELYSYILIKLQGRKKFIERMGFEVVDGLDEFMNLAGKFEQEHIPTMQGFVHWILKGDVEIKREQEQSDIDAIRVMTVHGSKGLQAPIVILPDTVRVAKTAKESTMLWDEMFYYPLSSDDYDKKCMRIKERDNELALDEYRRLLYVALTRAEDRLYICGYNSKGEAKDDSWYKSVARKIEEIGVVDGERIYIETAQQFEVLKKETEKAGDYALPDFEWMHKPAETESPLARPFAPSRDDEEEEVSLMSPIGDGGQSRYKRGIIIHKLLQFLPNVSEDRREKVALEFVEKNVPEIKGKERIVQEVLQLFDDERFKVLFGENSRDEVPIVGEVDGRIVSAQIDRLVVADDKVMIVDFKTNRPPARELKDVPKVYINQLTTYKKLLEKIYPDKEVETHILWTDVPYLMKI